MVSGTPAAIVAKLNGAVQDALADPDVRARLTTLGMEIPPHIAGGMGETKRRVLFDVGDGGAELRPVADRGPDLVPGVAHDDSDVPDSRPDDRLQAVEKNRLIGHRDQLLGARMGERAQA